MKKWIVMLVVLSLVCCCAGAEETGAGMLDAAEVQAMFAGALEKLAADGNVNVWDEEGMVCYGDPGCYVNLAEGEEPASDAEVLRYVLLSAEDGRKISVGDPIENVLRAYPCDNPSLRGSEYIALIYMQGDLAGDGTVLTGYVSREGHNADLIVYESISLSEDRQNAFLFGVRYTLGGDVVTAIEYFKECIDAAEAAALLDELAESQESGNFIPAVNGMSEGSDAEFCTEDLIFSGINMSICTMEELFTALGDCEADNWVQDGDQLLRICQWEGAEAVAVYTSEKSFVKVYSLKITGDIPGPRGIRLGDALRSVLRRFRHEAETGILYGNGFELPYGILTTTDTATLVRYACECGESMAELSLRFEEDVLCEILITVD